MGQSEPQVTFSPAFGAGFLVMHPVVYTKMLYERLVAHKANVWLINTGWTGGAYGIGKRIDVRLTRNVIDAIHAGALSAPSMNFVTTDVFNLQVPESCPGSRTRCSSLSPAGPTGPSSTTPSRPSRQSSTRTSVSTRWGEQRRHGAHGYDRGRGPNDAEREQPCSSPSFWCPALPMEGQAGQQPEHDHVAEAVMNSS